MTRETYAVAVFYPALVADLVRPSPALHAVVAIAAAAFLVCQARILHAGKGIPAWRVDLVPWMLVAAGLYEGVALALLGHIGIVGAAFLGVFGSPGSEADWWGPGQVILAPAVLAGAGVLLAVLNAALFGAYRRQAANAGVGPLARRELDATARRVRRLGHVVPAALFAAPGLGFVLLIPFLPMPHPMDCEGALCLVWAALVLFGLPGTAIALVVAAGCVLAGGALWKYTLITRACHQQGFALPRLPQRGSGTRAAPARFGLG